MQLRFLVILGFLVIGGLQADEPNIGPIQQLYALGDQAMEAKDYHQALRYFGEILGHPAKDLLSEAGRADIRQRRAEALYFLNDNRAALAELQQIESAKLPPLVLLKVQILRARMLNEEDVPIAAYEILRDLDQNTQAYQWKPEERALVIEVTDKVNQYYDRRLQEAGRDFDGGSYKEAVTGYEEVLHACERSVYPWLSDPEQHVTQMKIYYRLTQCYYLLGDYQRVPPLVDAIDPDAYRGSPELGVLEQSMTFLSGLAYRRMGKQQEAIDALERYLRFGKSAKLTKEEEARWELGLAYFETGNHDRAREFFEPFATQLQITTQRGQLSRIYLARTALNRRNYPMVSELLEPLQPYTYPDKPLRFEVSYLLGESAFYLKEYQKAAEFFEKALPDRNGEKAEWVPRTLYNLGWAYLKLAEVPETPEAVIRDSLDKAERAFHRYVAHVQTGTEKAYLALAQVFLTRGHLLKDERSYAMVEKLLGHKDTLQSVSQRAAGLLVRAEAARDYASREALYAELATEPYTGSCAQLTGRYYRGLNHYNEAKRLLADADSETAQPYLDLAVRDLVSAGQQMTSSVPSLAALAFKYAIEALCQQGGQQHFEQSLAICNSMISDQSHLLEALAEPDEIWYLRGFVASRLATNPTHADHAKVSEESLYYVLKTYPHARYAPQALNLLATLYFQAEDYANAEPLFCALATRYPDSSEAAEAWFWTAECAAQLKRDPETIRSYRAQLVKQHPESTRAAESYFHFYGWGDYLRGDPAAIRHLSSLPEKFPGSPQEAPAQYLLGMHAKQRQDFTSALTHFERATTLPDSYVRERALLERAQCHVAIVERSSGARQGVHLEYAERDFRQALTECSDRDVLDQAELGLADVLKANGKIPEATAIADGIIQRYQETNVTSGYALSRALYLRARLVLDAATGDAAALQAVLESLAKAEMCARNGSLTQEERMLIHLSQAEALTLQSRHEEALRALSKVVNEEGSSPLRVQAMVERARVYKLQGQEELAVRQLRAAAQKEGQWAAEAKQLLEKDYGFN